MACLHFGEQGKFMFMVLWKHDICSNSWEDTGRKKHINFNHLEDLFQWEDKREQEKYLINKEMATIRKIAVRHRKVKIFYVCKTKKKKESKRSRVSRLALLTVIQTHNAHNSLQLPPSPTHFHCPPIPSSIAEKKKKESRLSFPFWKGTERKKTKKNNNKWFVIGTKWQ